MSIDKAGLAAMLRSVAGLWRQNTAPLSEIDSRFGDGDHGVTIGKIAALMERRLDGWEDQGIKGSWPPTSIFRTSPLGTAASRC